MSDDFTTPDPDAHPIEKARNRLATVAFVVCFVVLLAAGYAGLQRRAVLEELAQIDAAIAFWKQGAERATALADAQGPFGSPGRRQRYVEARSVEWLSSLCINDAGVASLEDRLRLHYEQRLREAQATVEATAAASAPTLYALRRSALTDAPIYVTLGASSPAASSGSAWCAPGFRPLGEATLLAYPAMLQFAEAFAGMIELGQREALSAQVRAELAAPSNPLTQWVAARFSAAYLSELMSMWADWSAERTWLLDELALEAVLVPDKDRSGYRDGAKVLDPFSGTLELPQPDTPPLAALAPFAPATGASPARYALDPGRARARAAFTAEQILGIVDDELKLLGQRRTTVERRTEPEANAANWSGIQLPLAMLVAMAVFPALGLYLLYTMYDARVALLPASKLAVQTDGRDFWFPRLGSPRDPLARPLPRDVQAALPRLSWLLFHMAPIALAYSASVLGLDPTGLLDRGSLRQPTDGLRIVFGGLLVLTFYTAVSATSVAYGSGGQPRTAPARERRWLVAQALAVLAAVAIVALPALAVLGVDSSIGFQSDAWRYDCGLLAALSAVMLWPRRRPSNFAWAACAALVVTTCVPYVVLALQVIDLMRPATG